MKAVLGVILLGALLLPVVSFSKRPAEVVEKPLTPLVEEKVSSSIKRIDGSMLSVDFEIARKDTARAVVLKITSTWKYEMTITHPANMGATAFLVMDENGNVIAPVPLDQDEDILYEEHEAIKLKPGKTFTYTISSSSQPKQLLSFLSNTCRYAYPLEFGKTYRIVVVYRPAGIWDKGGVCSAEKKIKFEAHPHKAEAVHSSK